MHINSTQYGMVSSVISVPSIFLALITGLVVDRIGVLNLMMPLISLVTLGMAIQTASAYLADFHLLMIGRFVYALGCESINTVKGIVINDWFLGKELSTANSINLSFVRGIVFVSGAFTPIIAENSSLTTAFSVGCLVCLVSVFAASQLHNY
jgi:MFS family permease